MLHTGLSRRYAFAYYTDGRTEITSALHELEGKEGTKKSVEISRIEWTTADCAGAVEDAPVGDVRIGFETGR